MSKRVPAGTHAAFDVGIFRVIGMAFMSFILVSCSADSPAATQASPEVSISVSPSPADIRPTPEPGESQGPLGGPAYVPEGGPQENEAPLVYRSDAASDPIPVEPASFTTEAVYSDGVVVATSDFSRGVVQGEGVGIVVGAEYVAMTVTVRNGSDQVLDLNAVIPALMYGNERTAAAPLYDEIEASDLTGSLEPGKSAEGVYGFLIPASATNPVLYVDLNGSHQPLVFRGDLP